MADLSPGRGEGLTATLEHLAVGEVWAEALWRPSSESSETPLQWFRSRGLKDNIIQEARLGYVDTVVPGWERFQGALSIPYHDGRHQEVGVRFRWVAGEQKYDQRKGSPHRLYGIHLVEEPVLWVTEGEFDSLILRQMGMPAVAIPGATAWQPHWRWLFRDCQEVFVVFDGDEPGRRGAIEVARSLKDITRVDVVDMPAGKDITDLYLETGPEGLRRTLQ